MNKIYNTQRVRSFIKNMTHILDECQDEASILARGGPLLSELLSEDDWLPPQFSEPKLERYQQYLLYCDPYQRFSLVSFVWGPGQATPLHNHTVWGMIGVLRGKESCQEYALSCAGKLEPGASHWVMPKEIDCVSPTLGDFHIVSNASEQVSVSIHCYGGNIGTIRRHIFDPSNGDKKEFISGYASPVLPNWWGEEGAQKDVR